MNVNRTKNIRKSDDWQTDEFGLDLKQIHKGQTALN